jgi:predicted dienelactone hydrolase
MVEFEVTDCREKMVAAFGATAGLERLSHTETLQRERMDVQNQCDVHAAYCIDSSSDFSRFIHPHVVYARAMMLAWRAALRALLILVIAGGLSAFAVAGASASEERLSLAGLAVTVWQPDAATRDARPTIIFSHGFHGCDTQARFLATALAGAGYLVFAPQHRDATCDHGGGRLSDPPEEPFVKPDLWSEAAYRDRAEDIKRLIAALKRDDAWRQRIDWGRLGLAGHSLGGYTVLGLAGAWPQWKLPGIKAVLALSPYIEPYLAAHSLSGLSVPVMYQGGTLDLGITPTVSRAGGGYESSPAPKYFVEFRDAGHLAWTDLGPAAAHAAIIAYSRAFFDHYLKGEPAAPLLMEPGAEVATLRFQSRQ